LCTSRSWTKGRAHWSASRTTSDAELIVLEILAAAPTRFCRQQATRPLYLQCVQRCKCTNVGSQRHWCCPTGHGKQIPN
jgi:hypothetical protein